MKVALDETRRDRKKGIKRILNQFEALLGQTVRAQWERIMERVCVKADKDPPPPSELNMTNLRRCLREFMLDIFKQDAAEKEREYLQFYLRLPWEMTLRAWVNRIRDLSRKLKYLPCLAEAEGAPEGSEAMNRPLSEIELCQLIMRAIPSDWADEYRVNHPFVKTDSDALVRELEPIETKDKNRKRRVEHGGAPIPRKKLKGDGGNNDKESRAGGPGGGGPKQKHCALCAKYGGAADTHNTADCKKYEKGGKRKAGFKPKGKCDDQQEWRKSYMTLMNKFDVLASKVEKSKKTRKRKRADSSDSE